MSTRSTFLIQVLEKLAAPLVAAISEVSVRNMMIPDPAKAGSMKPEAEQVAGLLTKSTQMSIALSGFVDLKISESEADSLRLALTSLSSPLMANIYRLAGRSPTDQEIERIAAAMDAVMSYADGFAPAGDATVRMSQINEDFFPADPAQITLMYMSAMLPAVNSVMAYSFGQSEKKLVQDVTERLIREARVLRTRLFTDMEEGSPAAAKADLAILRMAALIYSQCHFAEMAKLMATEDQVRQGMAPAMTSLWQSFILRMQMLEILGDVLIPDKREKMAEGTTKAPAQKTTPKINQSHQADKSDLPKTSDVVPLYAAPPASPPQAEQSSSGNPMSFFVKKNSA